MPDPIMTDTERRAIRFMRGVFHFLDIFAPGLGGRLAFRIFTTPRRFRTPAWEEEIRKTGTPFTIAHDGAALDALTWGPEEAPRVLLVHGWEGRGTQMGHFVEPLVAAGFRVIAFDGPAHGRSPGKHTSVPEFMRVFDTIADQCGPVYAFIGHSFGGAAGIAAVQSGFQVDRLVSIGSPAKLMYVMQNYRAILYLGDRVFERFLSRFQTVLGIHPRDVDITKYADALRIPGMIVHDRDDNEVIYENGEALHRSWSRARMLTTQGLRHRRVLKHPEVINAVVDFLRAGRNGSAASN
jgi:pimeloyl-ACP methyl ester carboxylesterase